MSDESLLTYPWQKSDWSKLSHQNANERLAHAYLVYGSAGIGKFDFILRFSKYLLCSSPSKNAACGKCINCRLHASAHPNIKLLKPENNSSEIKIDQIRYLTEFFNKTSHSEGFKISIINDADRLNINSTNALLKTLEEPSGASILFLCSSLPGQLSPTLRSRCQEFSMNQPNRNETLDWLKENSSKPIDINMLSRTMENGPLEILDLIESGQLEKQHVFIESFLNLLKGSSNIQSVTNAACELGERQSVDVLMKFFSKTIVMFFSNGGMNSDQSEKRFIEILKESSLTRRDLALRLFRYYDQVDQAYKELGGSSNLSSQLIIESLIWRGSQLDLN